MGPPNRTPGEKIAAAASRSHGIVTDEELRALGVSRKQVRTRVRNGTLLREFPGVYRAGHRAPQALATYLAAVRAAGPGALLHGRAAAWVHGLVKGGAPPPEVLASTERKLAGVRVMRARRGIDRGDASTRRGVPVTSVARTLVDLAAELDLDALALACHVAGVRHGTTPADVEAVLRRRPSSPGAGNLRRVLHGDVNVSLSRLERRFLDLLEHHELRIPSSTNKVVGGRRVDCHWREPRLTIELDGYLYHRSRHAWERDRRREREARARGDEFRRYTYADVFESSRLMLRELAELLPAAAR